MTVRGKALLTQRKSWRGIKRTRTKGVSIKGYAGCYSIKTARTKGVSRKGYAGCYSIKTSRKKGASR
jgi:hypothetical protein